ncbi:hypothetical protein C1I95_24730 [Micromonospora craterilacus]|uniref:Uncharacterized protein n=1 Tax=Micromonospora craterilacus TaxID=1655439 RepID=A0A2W2DRU8_9ACTN|nr:hypothetical protein [Micromonospora craterilacus]PZG12951.1 hypothetical protein C1I95_24730 [Micromonospora craterilacus]
MTATHRRRSTDVAAVQWWQHGDHPAVQAFRHSAFSGEYPHESGCGRPWDDHGWINTDDAGIRVCPGDWIITEQHGRLSVVHPPEFEADYEVKPSAPSGSDVLALLDRVAPEYGHARVQAGADALVRLRTQAPSLAELDADEQRHWLRDARAALDAAGMSDLMREVAKARHLGRMADRHALRAEQEVAEVSARLANREADIARHEAQQAGWRLAINDAEGDRDRLIEAIGRLVSLPPEQAGEAYGVTYRSAASRRAGEWVVDGGVRGVLVICGECGGEGLLHQPDQPPESQGEDNSDPCTGCGCPREYHDDANRSCAGDFLACRCEGYAGPAANQKEN